MSTVIILIICGALVGAIYYLLTETIQVNDKLEYQYMQCKLSHIETKLCLVKYLLKGTTNNNNKYNNKYHIE